MATYPAIMGANSNAGAKQSRMNKIFGARINTTAIEPARKYQPKGPNMFKRMIRGLVAWSMNDNHRYQEDVAVSEETCRISATGIKFEVYRANGGTVVETRRYNRKNDDNIYELHVITDSQDIGQEIGRIITMEALKS